MAESCEAVPAVAVRGAVSARALPPRACALSPLMQAIGTPRFADRMLEMVATTCGADHFAVFELTGEHARAITCDPSNGTHHRVSLYEQLRCWRRDRLMLEAMQCARRGEARLMQADIDQVMDVDLRRTLYPTVSERLIVCARHGDTALGLSLLRSVEHGRMQATDTENLALAADHLMAALAKHCEFVRSHRPTAQALASLESIEACLRDADLLPPRELQVCARILFGVSALGIGLQLGIGEESAKTYRKRIFKRLELGSPRELLMWYFDLWDAYRP